MIFQCKKWPDRFWAKVQKGDGCWLWTGARNAKGYGVLQMGDAQESRTELAHRVAWSLEHGPIPKGVKILHRCDNPPCVRHLFSGSQADNMHDSAEKGRHPRNRTKYLPTGKRHHAYERGHKLTRDQALQIRAEDGTYADIAARHDVDKSLVCLIKAGKIWRDHC
jgi:hypothetical protein